MDKEFRKLLEQHKDNSHIQFELAGITEENAPAYIAKEMAVAIEEQDWDAWQTLFGMACSISSYDVKAAALNELLLMPGHELHQEVTREIQLFAHPSSVVAIRKILEQGFSMFEYTCSEDGVIAKWFSHALASIGTPEAIDVIKQFAQSSNDEVAAEMKYRLEKIHA
jgi:hypothetical protein